MRSVKLTEQDILDVSTVQTFPLGELGTGADGKEYRYAKYGATVTPGVTLSAAPNVANHLDRAPGADVAVGADTITVVLGATAVAQDAYAGGTLLVTDGSGEGQQFRIKGNTAAGSGGTTTVKIYGKVATALVASADSTVSLYPNKFNGVTVDTTVALRRVGVSTVGGASGSYAWVQVKGAAGVLISGATTAIADPVIPIVTVAGAVGGIGTVAATDQIIGIALEAGVDTEYHLVDLCIE